MLKRNIFISDLHLDHQLPAITHHFLTLLSELNEKDSLYILGDLFEYWVGDDDVNPFLQSIMDALRQTVARGVRIYIQRGNRDFLLGETFFKKTQCQLLPDEYKVRMFDRDVLLMHGDTLCTQDKSYQYFRRIVRHPFTQFLYFLLPLSLRRHIVNTARRKSQKYSQKKSDMKMDVTQNAVISAMQKHEVNYLIHGHTHQPNIHTYKLDNLFATRIVLGAWHPKGKIFIWDEHQKALF